MTTTVGFSWKRIREIKQGGMIELKDSSLLPEGLEKHSSGTKVLELLDFVFRAQRVIFAGSISQFAETLHDCSDEYVRQGFSELQNTRLIAITGDYFIPTSLFVDRYK